MSKGYDIGYGKPPKHSRFQKGKSGNPAGRPKKYKSPINALVEPVTMTVNGKRHEVDVFEASLRKTVQLALEGHLSAIKRFFKYCDEAGLLIDQNKAAHCVCFLELDPSLFTDRELTEAELAEVDRINKQNATPPPRDPPTKKQAITIKVAGEKHFVLAFGRQFSIFELVQQKLRHCALIERHDPSHAYFEELITRTTLDIDPSDSPLMVMVPEMPMWLTPLRIEDADTNEEIRIPRPGEPDFDPKLHS